MLLAFACMADWRTRSHAALERHATDVDAMSTEYGFALWLAWGTTFQGWTSAVLKQEPKGLDALAQGLAAIRGYRRNRHDVRWLMLLA